MPVVAATDITLITSRASRVPLQLAQNVNEVWSMDFVRDSLANDRCIKCLTVADDFSHEYVDIAADYGISGQYVTRLLDQAAMFRGHPSTVRTDNGPEFTSRAFLAWTQTHGIRHILIQPGQSEGHRAPNATGAARL